jgi:hypothetical protein
LIFYECSDPVNIKKDFRLTGENEIEATDGKKLSFGQDSILFSEDTTGMGHRGRIIGSEDALLFIHKTEIK